MGCSSTNEIQNENEKRREIKTTKYDSKDKQKSPILINRNEKSKNNKKEELKNNDENNKNISITHNDNKLYKINEQKINSIESESKKEENIKVIEDIKNKISFKCFYETKDNDEIQILNYRNEDNINEEIKSKIKILNNNKKEDLIYKKKFDKIGLNDVEFIIEGMLNNISFLFYDCSSLKKIEFISFETS